MSKKYDILKTALPVHLQVETKINKSYKTNKHPIFPVLVAVIQQQQKSGQKIELQLQSTEARIAWIGGHSTNHWRKLSS